MSQKKSRARVGALLVAALVVTTCARRADEPPSHLAPPRVAYVYDEAGRLRAVSDLDGDTAIYAYDPAGNLLWVDRFPSDEASVLAVTPARGGVGDEVVVQGTGFADDGGDVDVDVSFGGVAASVTEASATQLTVVVPEGAETGPVTVAGPGGSAESEVPFAVEGDRVPEVEAVSPTLVAPGDRVTIEGARFSADPALDAVVIDGSTYAPIASAGEGRLVATVPATATPGPVSVATPEGTGRGPDLFVVPEPYAVEDVAQAERAQLGEPTEVAIDSPGQVALVAFRGERGRRVDVELSDDEFPACGLGVGLVGPGGVELARAGPALAQVTATCSGEPPDVGPLPVTGTYTLVLAAGAVPGTEATGSVTVTVTDADPEDETAATTAAGFRRGRAGDGAAGAFAPPGGVVAGNDRYPVDLATGGLAFGETDMVADELLPATLGRTYQPGDPTPRGFGLGSALEYDLALEPGVGNQSAQLVLPNGVGVRYDRTSEGTDEPGATFEHTATPTALYGSRITWNGVGWDLELRDGTTLVFAATTTLRDPLQAIRDRHGNQVTVRRERDRLGTPSGRVLSVHTRSGRSIAFAYDDRDRVTEARDDRGRAVRYAYDDRGRLARVAYPGGAEASYGYDAEGRLASISSPAGGAYLTVAYDGAGRVARQAQADGGAFTFAYEADGEGRVTQAVVTDPAGVSRRVAFAGGYLASDTAAVGTPAEQTVSYEREGDRHLVTAVVGPGGRRTAYAYDAAGNATSVTEADGTPDAATTAFEYDADTGLVTSVTDPLDRTWSYAYDDAGNVTREVGPTGEATTYGYDSLGRLTAVTDAAGATTSVAYALGHRVVVTDAAGAVTSEFAGPSGAATVATDPLGRRWDRRFDALDRLVGVTDPAGGEVALSYDRFGNTASLTDANGNATTWSYDAMGRVSARTDPLGAVDRYAYDPAGNLASHTDRRGLVTGYRYDPLGRPSGVAFGDGSTVAYAYDEAGSLASVEDSAYGTVTRAYDAAGRLVREESPGGRVDYAYDAAGQRTSLSVDGGPEVTYAYDDAGRVASIAQGESEAAVERSSEDGRVRRLRLPADVTADYAYDPLGRLQAIDYAAGGEALGGVGYGYDAAGRRVTVAGELAATVVPPPVGDAAYDAGNRLTRWSGAALSYDAAGNLVDDGTSTYTWDARGQLAAVDGPVAATFAYDPFGRRVAKEVDGAATAYTYDGPNVAAAGEATYLTGLAPDEAFARTGPSPATYLTDGLGSVVGLVGEDGTVATRYALGPHGAVSADGADDPNPFAFTGRELDETGLYYHRARYYQPATGRFVSQDPLGFAAGDANTYAYVGGDPVNAVDPSGLCGLDLIIGSFALLFEMQDTFSPGGRLNPGSVDDPFSADYLAAVDDYLSTVEDRNNLNLITSCGMMAAGVIPGLVGTAGISRTTGFASTLRGTRTSSGLASTADDATRAGASTGGGLDDATRVGRWMSPDEYDAMVQTGNVQIGAGGTTRVARPPSPESYMRQAPVGDYYVEFDVPSSSLFPAGRADWAQIPGPNNRLATLAVRRGQPLDFPVIACNISHLATRIRC